MPYFMTYIFDKITFKKGCQAVLALFSSAKFDRELNLGQAQVTIIATKMNKIKRNYYKESLQM